MNVLRRCAVSIALGFGIASTVNAQGTALLAEVFQDHAVLQRDRSVPIWGSAKPNSDVVVSVLGVESRTRADAQGTWRVELPAMAAGLSIPRT